MRVDGSQRKVWGKFAFKKEQKNEETKKSFNEALTLSVYDCAERTQTIIHWVFYDSNENIVEEDQNRAELGVAIPDTRNEEAVEYVCNYNKNPIARIIDKAKSLWGF